MYRQDSFWLEKKKAGIAGFCKTPPVAESIRLGSGSGLTLTTLKVYSVQNKNSLLLLSVNGRFRDMTTISTLALPAECPKGTSYDSCGLRAANISNPVFAIRRTGTVTILNLPHPVEKTRGVQKYLFCA